MFQQHNSYEDYDASLQDHYTRTMRNNSHNLSYNFVSFTLQKEYGYSQQCSRPIQLSFDANFETQLYDIGQQALMSRKMIPEEDIIGMASSIAHPTLNPALVRNTNVINGWGERRFSFSLILDCIAADSPGTVKRYTVTGYSNHSEMAGNLIDPNTEFHVDRVGHVILQRYTNEMGNAYREYGGESVQMMRSTGDFGGFNTKRDLLQKPDTLLKAASMISCVGNPGEMIMERNQIPELELVSTPQFVSTEHSTPTGMISKTLASLVAAQKSTQDEVETPHDLARDSLQEGVGFGTYFGMDTSLAKARKMISSDNIKTEFNRLLTNLNGRSSSTSNVFTLRTLNEMFGRDLQDDITVNENSMHGNGLDSDSWLGSAALGAANYEVTVAEVIRNIIPKILSQAGLLSGIFYITPLPGYGRYSDLVSIMQPENYKVSLVTVMLNDNHTHNARALAEEKAVSLILRMIVAEYFKPEQCNFELMINAGLMSSTIIQFRSDAMSGQTRRFETPAWATSINSHLVTGDQQHFVNNVVEIEKLNNVAHNLVSTNRNYASVIGNNDLYGGSMNSFGGGQMFSNPSHSGQDRSFGQPNSGSLLGI